MQNQRSFDAHDDVLLMELRSTLPVQITSVENVTDFGARIIGISGGVPWVLDIDCDVVLTADSGNYRNRYDLLESQLVGRGFLEVDAPGDAFDPVFRLDNGWELQLLSEDENNPWYLSCGDVEVEGLPWQDHEQWLNGDLDFS